MENIYDELKARIYEKIAQALHGPSATPILDIGCGDFIRGGEAERLWGERYYTVEEFKSMLELSGFKQTEEDFLYEAVIFIQCFS